MNVPVRSSALGAVSVVNAMQRIFRSSTLPCLHHRKEGRLRHQQNFAKPPKPTQTGGFPFALIGKPPRPRYQWRLRDTPLIARPPLLAVMQGGECACSKLIHTPPPVRLHTLSIFGKQVSAHFPLGREKVWHIRSWRIGARSSPNRATREAWMDGVNDEVNVFI